MVNGHEDGSEYGGKRTMYDRGNNLHTSSGYIKSRSNKSSFYQQ